MANSDASKRPVKFSYSGDPSTSTRDAVRFLVGDTDHCDPLLDDREVDFLVTAEGTAISAAVCAALAIAARYSRLADSSVGDAAESAAQKAEHYRQLSRDLALKRSRRAVAPFAGGISRADKDTRAVDADRVDPAFTRRLHDNPETQAADDDVVREED